MTDIDLSIFDEKMSWSDRHDLIRETFPSVEKLDWHAIFRNDPAVMGRIVNDVLKILQAEPGRPGKRPALDSNKAQGQLARMRGEDYSMLPFREALEILKGERSIRSISSSVGMPKTTIHRFLDGTQEPTVGQLVQIAQGMRKHPSYFLEYRIAFVQKAIADAFRKSPESSVVQFEKLMEKK